MVEAWYMDEAADDPRLPHRAEPARPVGLEQLRRLGVLYWKLDADKYENDPELEKIRKERNYSWMDIITICKDKLPNYEEKVSNACLICANSSKKSGGQTESHLRTQEPRRGASVQSGQSAGTPVSWGPRHR